jgi:hypothetical protein
MKIKNIDITSFYPYKLSNLLKLTEKGLCHSKTKLPDNFYLYFMRIRGNFKL